MYASDIALINCKMVKYKLWQNAKNKTKFQLLDKLCAGLIENYHILPEKESRIIL